MPVTATRPRRPHPSRCLHCVSVDAYRAARIAAEQEREQATRGWATETAEYGAIITFKEWLIMGAGAGQYASDYDYEEAA